MLIVLMEHLLKLVLVILIMEVVDLILQVMVLDFRATMRASTNNDSIRKQLSVIMSLELSVADTTVDQFSLQVAFY